MRIPLRRTFQIVPEGLHVFYIESVEMKEDFGKLQVHMVTKEGIKHTERFSFLDSKGEWNDKALNAFAYFAQNAINDFAQEDIDPEELVGHYIKAEIKHTVQPNKNDPTKTVTFANMGDKFPADSFEDGSTATLGGTQQSAPAAAPASGTVDLMALLDD